MDYEVVVIGDMDSPHDAIRSIPRRRTSLQCM